MAQRTLEERVTALEKRVSKILSPSRKATKDWQRTLGMFTEDEEMKQLFQEALRLRERDRQRARRRNAKNRDGKR